MGFETVIGLEIHAELATESKMFCGCSTDFGGEPNSRTCPVCLGHPGVLPVANREAVASTILLGLALRCAVTPRSVFHRKNYFYPDMPKNFQISQYDVPLTSGGTLSMDMEGYTREVGITRVHLEEDTGKSIHIGESGRIHGADFSLEDFNRAGIPLAEIVTEPDMRSPEEARVFMQLLRATLEYLGISDCKMEEGSLRCDANISVSVDGRPGTKVEIKNMNSFRSLFRALSFEEERQRTELGLGHEVVQETRHWDDAAGVTHPLRSKEEAFDYRYFPEPDLVPIEPDLEWVEELRGRLPELPRARRNRFEAEYGLPGEISAMLTGEKALADYFEEAVASGQDPVALAKWIAGDLVALLNEAVVPIQACPVHPRGLGELVALVAQRIISGKMAKDVLREAFETGKGPERIVREKGLAQIEDEGELEAVVDRVIEENPDAASDMREGKEQALKFLMGRVMKATRGKANPELATSLIRKKLSP
ncbi:MAG: Asp-tRNA(Asn)/Glu-tRNA(Gln) amidotransferase subunit GatB [Actinobacteria bacterium]|nr:Asp-tRNA(Asn)/Glu-tRNA(Gln) amidotransferase subunit GatB [Actinomycetota bacterium]MBU1944099.1 Asp-tRNA(Asn)/Glu-tRNA(Gln) amidotransferase subunit GatB [Actinomycetota bacterium]MBU2687020.1 Asp-tRNA(Asn)/Glu-tRNA(Gln) amidotransferase subunit GatB [Actinomycetota bacterium]